jgi:hypothetical protein
MFINRSQKDSWADSGFDRDALRFMQPRFAIPWRTSIPMFLCIEEPRDTRHSRDKTLPWVDTPEPPARKPARKMKKQETKKERQKANQPITVIIFTKMSKNL